LFVASLDVRDELVDVEGEKDEGKRNGGGYADYI